MPVVLLIAGFLVLTLGAEALVRGASRLAAAFGIAPLIIGLTVVAFGTSAPEMAVSALSGLRGQADVALGNVVGSNIFNVLCVLGLSALITPLTVLRQLIRQDVPVMIAATLIVCWMSMDGVIGRTDGLLLFAGIMFYTAWLIFKSRRDGAAAEDNFEKKYAPREPRGFKTLLKNGTLTAAGIGLLVLGSRWLVDGATAIALSVGMSELTVGLTIVAFGTSLPEAATSIVASLRKEPDIAVGNIIGSNLFNLMAVLGLAGAVTRDGIAVAPAALHFDLPVMAAVAIACLPVFITGGRISRGEGALFFGYYLAYMTYLILKTGDHAAAPAFGSAMLFFVIPLTLITASIILCRKRPAALRSP